MSFPIVLDISRTISRASRPVPTGIDRVELAYARHLIQSRRSETSFAAVSAWGRIGPVRTARAIAFIQAVGARWGGEAIGPTGGLPLRLSAALQWQREHPIGPQPKEGPPIYLLVSHHHLDRPAALARLKSRIGARLICLVHDLIPMTHPEYARPGHASRHLLRMRTVSQLADAVIVNSGATYRSFSTFLERGGRAPPVVVAPLGTDLPRLCPEAAGEKRPYFVALGTIEPRKNHLLLLHLWRRLASEHGVCTPRLVLVGQRGWENENIVDMIERCAEIREVVQEKGPLPDREVARLLAGARALLLPSFAEGFGLPVAEALTLGVPVLCSNIESLQEIGGDVAEYLDPLDGPAWYRAILDYAQEPSGRRAAQLTRLAAWHPPSWEKHFAIVEELLDDTASHAVSPR